LGEDRSGRLRDDWSNRNRLKIKVNKYETAAEHAQQPGGSKQGIAPEAARRYAPLTDGSWTVA